MRPVDASAPDAATLQGLRRGWRDGLVPGAVLWDALQEAGLSWHPYQRPPDQEGSQLRAGATVPLAEVYPGRYGGWRGAVYMICGWLDFGAEADARAGTESVLRRALKG